MNARELAAHGELTDLSDGESVVALRCGFPAAPGVLVHPHVQYVTDPGSFSYKHMPNTWAFGLQTKLVL